MERFCRECGVPLTGRSDKQFCSDDCRTAWHNRFYRSDRSGTTEINKALRLNRRLLLRVYSQGLRSISLADARMRGFDRRYFTAIEKRLLHWARYHCYEFSFRIHCGKIVALTKAED